MKYINQITFYFSEEGPGRGSEDIKKECNVNCFDFLCRVHLWFRLMGGLQTKSMTSQRNRALHKMADMRYYGNVMTTTRWRLYVTMETLWQQQDGGYSTSSTVQS